MTNRPPYLSIKECAQEFGISLRELTRYVASRWVRTKKGLRSKQGPLSIFTADVAAVQEALGRGKTPKRFRHSRTILTWDKILCSDSDRSSRLRYPLCPYASASSGR